MVSHARIIPLPRLSDPRGNLSFAESARSIPFVVERACWMYEIVHDGSAPPPTNSAEFVIALAGFLEITVLHDAGDQRFTLDRPDIGLYLPQGIRRRFSRASANAACLSLFGRPMDPA